MKDILRFFEESDQNKSEGLDKSPRAVCIVRSLGWQAGEWATVRLLARRLGRCQFVVLEFRAATAGGEGRWLAFR